MLPKTTLQISKPKIILGLCLIIVLVVLWYVFIIAPFHIVRTNPSSHNVASLTPFFNVEFNKPLSVNGLAVSSSPNVIQSYAVEQKTLVINLIGLMKIGTTYTIDIHSVEATGGHKLTNKIFRFMPQDIAYANLPKDQQTAIQNSPGQNDRDTLNNDPILVHLPYGTLNYNLTPVYATVNGHATLEINAQLLLSYADLSSPQSKQAAITLYESEINQYISSFGLNPSNYIINYSY